MALLKGLCCVASSKRAVHLMLLCIAACLWSEGVTVAAAVANEESDDSHCRIENVAVHNPTASSKAAARIRPSHTTTTTAHLSPKTNLTLSEKLESLPRGGGSNDFADRLRQEEEQAVTLANPPPRAESSSSSHPNSNNHLGLSLIGLAASLLLVSSFTAPSAFWQDVWTTSHTLVSLHWLRQLHWPMDFVVVAHVLTRPGTLEAFQEHVWPTLTSTLRSVLLAELWSYIWKVTWKTMLMWGDAWAAASTSVATSTTSEATTVATTDTSETGPQLFTWLLEHWSKTSEAVDGILWRGTRRILQKVLQRNLQETIVRLASRGANLVQEQWYSKMTTTTTKSSAPRHNE